ncbi:hypothetical protein HDV05_000210 [Chytridiales sp. JEL 0842]|nr:hypothetical protein HDV05_000210 [Chytridiales sp. JEL 0842]
MSSADLIHDMAPPANTGPAATAAAAFNPNIPLQHHDSLPKSQLDANHISFASNMYAAFPNNAFESNPFLDSFLLNQHSINPTTSQSAPFPNSPSVSALMQDLTNLTFNPSLSFDLNATSSTSPAFAPLSAGPHSASSTFDPLSATTGSSLGSLTPTELFQHLNHLKGTTTINTPFSDNNNNNNNSNDPSHFFLPLSATPIEAPGDIMGLDNTAYLYDPTQGLYTPVLMDNSNNAGWSDEMLMSAMVQQQQQMNEQQMQHMQQMQQTQVLQQQQQMQQQQQQQLEVHQEKRGRTPSLNEHDTPTQTPTHLTPLLIPSRPSTPSANNQTFTPLPFPSLDPNTYHQQQQQQQGQQTTFSPLVNPQIQNLQKGTTPTRKRANTLPTSIHRPSPTTLGSPSASPSSSSSSSSHPYQIPLPSSPLLTSSPSGSSASLNGSPILSRRNRGHSFTSPSSPHLDSLKLPIPPLSPRASTTASTTLLLPIPPSPLSKPAPPTEPTLTPEEKYAQLDEALLKIDFEDVTVMSLKDLLRERGLPSYGKKSILVERIKEEMERNRLRKEGKLKPEEDPRHPAYAREVQLGVEKALAAGGQGPVMGSQQQQVEFESSNGGGCGGSPGSPLLTHRRTNVVRSTLASRQRSQSESGRTRPRWEDLGLPAPGVGFVSGAQVPSNVVMASSHGGDGMEM